MHTPLRAARMPGSSTLWTRTLDRLLSAGTEAGARARPMVAAPEEQVRPVADDRAAAVPVTRPDFSWMAPARLPEMLSGGRAAGAEPRRGLPLSLVA